MRVLGLMSGTSADGVEAVLVDFKTDIAILKSKNKGESIKISKKKIEHGNQVCVIGNSFGLGQSLSCGIISSNWYSKIRTICDMDKS